MLGNPWSRMKSALLGVWLLAAGVVPVAVGAETSHHDRHGLTAGAAATNVGIQPLGVPSGVISAVLARDRILQATLKERGAPLKTYSFKRGPDIVPLLADGRLEAGLLGDMPTLLAVAEGKAVIAGLIKQTSTAIVARDIAQVGELVGKRIGYVELSSAHHTLLQGLSSAGIDERQVRLVPMAVNDMPDALERGDIDAFAGWEPAPAIALAGSRGNRVLFRSLSKDFLVVDRGFVARNPEAATLLAAGLVRAVEWLRHSRGHLERAIAWANADAQAFVGKPHALSAEKIARIVHQEILDIPAAPVIPGRHKADLLKSEFEFLGRLGKLPAGAQWRHVEEALRYDGMARALADPRRYRTREFDYPE